jgi:hypothetical protein
MLIEKLLVEFGVLVPDLCEMGLCVRHVGEWVFEQTGSPP